MRPSRKGTLISVRLAASVAFRIASGTFTRLAVTERDPPLLVADNDQGGESEPAPAFDDLGHAVDVNQLVDKLAVFPIAIPSVSPALPALLSCHVLLMSVCSISLTAPVTSRALRR